MVQKLKKLRQSGQFLKTYAHERTLAAGKRGGVWVLGRARNRQLTILGVCLATLAIILIPQLGALFDIPDLDSGPTMFARWSLLAIRCIIVALYVAMLWCIVPPEATEDPGFLRVADEWMDRKLGRRADALLTRAGQLKRWWAIPFFLTVAAFLRPWSIVLGARWNPHPLAFDLLLLGAWLLVMQKDVQRFLLPRTGVPSDPPSGKIQLAGKIVGRAVTFALFGSMLGEIVWLMQPYIRWGIAYKVYSSWGVIHLFWIVLVSLRVVDALARLEFRYIRVLSVLALFAVILFLPAGESVGLYDKDLKLQSCSGRPTTEAEEWFAQVEARLQQIPSDEPVIVVAASGGGSRAALLSALSFEKLKDMTTAKRLDVPLRMAESGKGARSLADNILLISSVSGGSLASAYFAAPPSSQADQLPRSLFADSIERAVGKEMPMIGKSTPVVHSAFVDDMGTDFTAPLLRGILNFLQERGRSVSNFWGEAFNWKELRDASWCSADAALGIKRPLLLFNATSVQTGRRVVLSFPRLPARFLDNDSMLTLTELAPKTTVTLDEAVRVSANFPYGFDYALLEVGDDENGGNVQNNIEMIDGGVVDNTGLDTLAALFERLQAAANITNESKASEQLPVRAAELLAKLRQRGVLLLEIDAGARPGPTNWLSKRFPTLSMPVNALQQASHLNASRLREQNIARIRNAIEGGDSGVRTLAGVVRVGFDCHREGDVMTAWTLSTSDVASIVKDFARIEKRVEEDVQLQFAALAQFHAAKHAAQLPDSAALQRAAKLRIMLTEYLQASISEYNKRRASAQQCNDATLHNASDEETADGRALRCEIGEQSACAGDGRAQRVAFAPAVILAPQAADLAAEAREKPELKAGGGTVIPGPPSPVIGEKAIAEQVSKVAPKPSSEARSVSETIADASISRPKEGWVYIGDYRDDRWVSKYLTWGREGLPKQGDLLSVIGVSNVRDDMPNAYGELARAGVALGANTVVKVLEVKGWQDTGLTWARVSYGRSPVDAAVRGKPQKLTNQSEPSSPSPSMGLDVKTDR